ncbi:MAG: DUF1512 domain-containing protein [Candidatus Helarchaeota archaeon]
MTYTSDNIWVMVFNMVFFGIIMIMSLYAQKIQSMFWLKAIKNAVDKLQEKTIKSRDLLVEKIKEVGKPKKDPKSAVNSFLEFFTVIPVNLDPAGVIQRLEHILDIRKTRWEEHVKHMAPEADEINAANIENALEAALGLHQIFKIVRHFYILGKKSKSMIVIMQIQMQLSLIMQQAKAVEEAIKAFINGKPIGDSVGPLVVSKLVRKYESETNPVNKIEDYVKDINLYELNVEDRKVYVIRAKGPGATVGKPGEAIKKLVYENDEISRLFMIDAGLRLEGEKTGAVIEGIGAVIGGFGVEKYKIEESAGVDKKLPMDGYVIKESLEDAYGPMKKEIADGAEKALNLIIEAIKERTKPNDKVIVAGIGNCCGVGD